MQGPVWQHKQQVTHRGEVKLMQSRGTFWGQIRDRSNGMLTGAFLGWIVRNAHDLVYRVEFWMERAPGRLILGRGKQGVRTSGRRPPPGTIDPVDKASG